MKTIHKILFFSFFMLIISNEAFSQTNELNHCFPGSGPCTAVSTTLTLSEYVKVGDCIAEVDFQYLKCGNPPNEVYTMNILGITLDCPSTPPSENDVMKAVKKYLLAIAYPLASNGDSYYPDDFEVQILAPTCYELVSEAGLYVASSTFNKMTTGKDDCEGCCDDTYTIDVNLGKLSVTSIERGGNSVTFCEPEYTTTCDNVCAENAIPEGVISTNNSYNCITTGATTYLFGQSLDGYSPARRYMSFVEFKAGSGSYQVSPTSIFGIGGDGVDDEDSMKDYIMDLINNRVSLFGVNANDQMILYINKCWENHDGNAYPCVTECCQFNINFTGINNDVIDIVYSNTGSVSCTSPCFEVCDRISDLDNETVANAKAIFETNENSLESLIITPNPTQGITNIEFNSDETGKVEMHIVTMDGQTVAKRYFEKSEAFVNYQFNTNSFSNGTYFIKLVLNGKEKATSKIIIQK